VGGLVKYNRTFSGKKVFLTGDSGFKGSWLALWLNELGADVTGYSLPPRTENDNYVASRVGDIIRHFDGDIRDSSSLQAAVSASSPEYIFHLAAQPLVRVSYRDPKTTFDTNVGGAVNLLEAARKCPTLRSIVFVTSDKCYRNREWVWGYKETDELGGHDPYSGSKAAAEVVFNSYLESFFLPSERVGAASVRAGNVIGGGDWSEDRIVPDSIRGLSAYGRITLRNPRSTRPWQHVLEPLSGYLLLALRLHDQPPEYSGAWNFGPESNSFRTVEDLAQEIVKNWKGGVVEVMEEQNAPHESRLLHLNCDKARQLLGWTPRWTFEHAVSRTVEWYKAANKAEVTVAQIREYMGQIND
jgi:CDP-glucose 4,6-dehydratase